MSHIEHLPMTSMTLDDARTRLTGWHFAKETLSETEQSILYVAEALLRHIDAQPTPAQDTQSTSGEADKAVVRALEAKMGCGPGEMILGTDPYSGEQIPVGQMCASMAHNHAYWSGTCQFAEEIAQTVSGALTEAGDPTAPRLSPAQQKMQTLAMQPGVNAVDIYDDAVEFIGGPDDSDTSAGLLSGRFSPMEVRAAVGEGLTITDRTTLDPWEKGGP